MITVYHDARISNLLFTFFSALPIANREALGIVVKYIVKIELFVSMGG